MNNKFTKNQTLFLLLTLKIRVSFITKIHNKNDDEGINTVYTVKHDILYTTVQNVEKAASSNRSGLGVLDEPTQLSPLSIPARQAT